MFWVICHRHALTEVFGWMWLARDNPWGEADALANRREWADLPNGSSEAVVNNPFFRLLASPECGVELLPAFTSLGPPPT
jgi:hypothetical protein